MKLVRVKSKIRRRKTTNNFISLSNNDFDYIFYNISSLLLNTSRYKNKRVSI